MPPLSLTEYRNENWHALTDGFPTKWYPLRTTSRIRSSTEGRLGSAVTTGMFISAFQGVFYKVGKALGDRKEKDKAKKGKTRQDYLKTKVCTFLCPTYPCPRPIPQALPTRKAKGFMFDTILHKCQSNTFAPPLSSLRISFTMRL